MNKSDCLPVNIDTNNMADWNNQQKNQGSGGGNTFLLQENDFFLLLETGGKIILNTGTSNTVWSNQIKQ